MAAERTDECHVLNSQAPARAPLPSPFLNFLKANDIDPSVYTDYADLPRYVRFRSDANMDAILSELETELGFPLQAVPWLPGFYSLPGSVTLSSCSAYRRGEMFGIDAASGAAVMALQIQPSDHVLDLCAAPGAKLCMIADLLQSQQPITSQEGSSSHLAAKKEETSTQEREEVAGSCASPSGRGRSEIKGGDSNSRLDTVTLGTVTGVDISAPRLAACRSLLQKYRLADRVRLFLGDATKFSAAPPVAAKLHAKVLAQMSAMGKRRGGRRRGTSVATGAAAGGEGIGGDENEMTMMVRQEIRCWEGVEEGSTEAVRDREAEGETGARRERAARRAGIRQGVRHNVRGEGEEEQEQEKGESIQEVMHNNEVESRSRLRGMSGGVEEVEEEEEKGTTGEIDSSGMEAVDGTSGEVKHLGEGEKRKRTRKERRRAKHLRWFEQGIVRSAMSSAMSSACADSGGGAEAGGRGNGLTAKSASASDGGGGMMPTQSLRGDAPAATNESETGRGAGSRIECAHGGVAEGGGNAEGGLAEQQHPELFFVGRTAWQWWDPLATTPTFPLATTPSLPAAAAVRPHSYASVQPDLHAMTPPPSASNTCDASTNADANTSSLRPSVKPNGSSPCRQPELHAVTPPPCASSGSDAFIMEDGQQLGTNSAGYDKVLVDAECTHDGSLKHILKYDSWGWDSLPRRFLQPERLSSLFELQLGLLRRGFDLLKRGGRLAYCTCSFTVAQNEEVVGAFLKEAGGVVKIVEVEEANSWPCKGGGIPGTFRFAPDVSNTSGLFLVVFTKL